MTNDPADVGSSWNNCLAAEETILETLIPHKAKNLITHRCPFVDNNSLNLKLEKRRRSVASV